MIRLILFAALIGILAFMLLAVIAAVRGMAPASPAKDILMPPSRLSRITYALLVVLLLGLSTGLLGGV